MTGKLFKDSKIIAYTDGGARGNPGPAAIGVVIGDKQYGEYIGETTNNVAEYTAVIFALKKLKQLLGQKGVESSDIEIHSDSELITKQINGEYKIKERELQNLFVEVWNLKMDFPNIKFVHIPREKNAGADKMVNEALDKHNLTK